MVWFKFIGTDISRRIPSALTPDTDNEPYTEPHHSRLVAPKSHNPFGGVINWAFNEVFPPTSKVFIETDFTINAPRFG